MAEHIKDDPLLMGMLRRIGEAEDAILGGLHPHQRALFDLARGVALVASAMHDAPEPMRLNMLRSVVATLQTCAGNLDLGVVLSIETRQ